MKVIFLHPDLGIGGAERLVVDAAVALKSKGHDVEFVTSHHDPTHCFTETSDGTFKVTTVCDWMPRTIFGRCYALCAYLRMILAAFYVVFSGHFATDLARPANSTVFFVDQISACIPVLKWFTNINVVFYCHFPDQLLANRRSWAKSIYRVPIDWLEEKTTGMADTILVNSKFTAEIFKATFSSLAEKELKVVYPSIKTNSVDQDGSDDEFTDIVPSSERVLNEIGVPSTTRFLLLSINRYERKKNVSLAIQSLALLESKLKKEEWLDTHLVIAGGYDTKLPENVQHCAELEALVSNLQLGDHVTFVRSCSAETKQVLLASALCLLYTPSHEHFGIVPLEGMQQGVPVIAVNSGGPLETIVHDGTGYLAPPDSSAWAELVAKLVKNPGLKPKLGAAGRQRVEEIFSFSSFSNTLDTIVTEVPAS